MNRLLSLLLTVILYLPGMETGVVNLGSDRTEESIEVVIRESVERQSQKKTIIPLATSTEVYPQTEKPLNTQITYFPEPRRKSIYLLNRSLLI
jgi:hypothetical protein